MLRFLFLLVIFMYLLSTLLPQQDFSVLLSILCFIIVLSTFFLAKHSVQLLGSAFLLLGVVLLWKSGSHWHHYILSFGPMLDLITLFTLVPILGIPIKIGGYRWGHSIYYSKKDKKFWSVIYDNFRYFLFL
ncbi:membrane-bound ClpP family serine protease [Neobacillus niacini]|nr:membrane-bound ClpP family serine protease [Neobacillus niacini]